MWKFGSKIKNKKHKLYYSQRRMQNCFVKDQKMHCRCYALVIHQTTGRNPALEEFDAVYVMTNVVSETDY